MKIGLRVDVDTFRGTKLGVPSLCKLLARRSITATFFFCVGPDNMGRHLWRLLRPRFLTKMLRTRAASLYGWDILLRGTFWPGPVIGQRLGNIIRATADEGHEIGLHAWDHHSWQAKIERMPDTAIHTSIRRGVELLTSIIGHSPACSAAPAWKCTDIALVEKDKFSFAYNSDCRGHSIFKPVVNNAEMQPQVPVTLPTYDELIGRSGVSDANYNEHLLSLLDPNGLNVLTIHAEVEGIACLQMFERFVEQASAEGAEFVPLGSLVAACTDIPSGSVVRREAPGREGWTAWQN